MLVPRLVQQNPVFRFADSWSGLLLFKFQITYSCLSLLLKSTIHSPHRLSPAPHADPIPWRRTSLGPVARTRKVGASQMYPGRRLTQETGQGQDPDPGLAPGLDLSPTPGLAPSPASGLPPGPGPDLIPLL